MPRPAFRTFSPGFRLSPLDIAILIGGGPTSIALGHVDRWLGVAVAFVVVHFFLFCNVLRMSRVPELIWAGVFAGLAAAAIVFAVISWTVVLGASTALTVLLALRESRRPSYHGVGWKWLNPKLPAWWSTHIDGGA